MRYLTLDIINRIMDEVQNGKAKKQVATELGISYRLVRHYTRDIRRKHFYSQEEIKRIRMMVRRLNNKAEVAHRLGIPYDIVLKNTLDIKVHNKTFGEKTWDLLREIMEQGYAFPNDGRTTKLYILRKHFPRIQMARAIGKSIAYLPERKEEAMRALFQRFNKKVWTYHELRVVVKLFDSDLSRKEKKELVGEYR